MNTQEPTELPPLPELSDSRIDEIEEALFAGIARERVIQQGETRRLADRRHGAGARCGGLPQPPPWSWCRRWPSAPCSAASESRASAAAAPRWTSAPDLGGAVPQEGSDGGAGFVNGRTSADADAAAGSSVAERDIIATAQATVRVDDVATSAQAIGAAAESAAGTSSR